MKKFLTLLILLFIAQTIYASPYDLYEEQQNQPKPKKHFLADVVEDLEGAIFQLNGVYETINYTNQATGLIGNMPGVFAETRDNIIHAGHNWGIVSDEYILSKMDEEHKETLINDLLNTGNYSSKEEAEKYLAQNVLQNKQEFGGLDPLEASKQYVAQEAFKGIVDTHTQQGLMNTQHGLANIKQGLKEDNLAQQIQGAGDLADGVGDVVKNEKLNKAGNYLNDTASIVSDFDTITNNDTDVVTRLMALNRATQTAANFGSGNGIIRNGIMNPSNGTLNFNPNQSDINGVYNSVDPNVNSKINPQLAEAGYDKEMIDYLVNQVMSSMPQEVQSRIRFIESINALGYPGKITFNVEGSPPVPITGDQMVFEIGVETTSFKLSPSLFSGGLFNKNKMEAGFIEVAAEIKHPKWGTKKTTLQGSAQSSNKISKLVFTGNP
ncbi:MAG: hypothetical protein ACOCRX_12080, partial [Candidatus Woesearchaeota archaeon]